MNIIGGYFELELKRGRDYHRNALKLNTARNAFEYILRAKLYKKVYIPFYTCEVMLEPIQKLGIEYVFYTIDENFLPEFDFSQVQIDQAFLYTNYFGICDKQVRKIAEVCKNLIIDNAQAFFSHPLPGVDTFYSSRKFFGVPDGSYLFTKEILPVEFVIDVSYQRFNHLLGRIDLGAEMFFDAFKRNDASFINGDIKIMSQLTEHLMQSIDYRRLAQKRRRNFVYLHGKLKQYNQLSIDIDTDSVPMVYPFLVKHGKIFKKRLVSEKICVATYWPNVFTSAQRNSYELYLANNLVPLPIDQRYTLTDMKYIVKIIISRGTGG